MRPELAGAAQEQAGTFTVRKLWLERDRAADAGAGRNLSFSARSVMIFQNQIWFLAEKPAPRVICLDPESLQVKGSIAIPDELISREKNPRPPPSFLMVSEKWLTVAHRGQVFIGSRVDDQWRALVIPPSSYKPFLVEGVLYLLYDADRGDQLRMTNAARTSSAGSGLVRVALPQGTPDDLISSRRIPPQNELDGKPLGRPTELWQGPDGLTMATDASEEPRFRVYASASLSDWRTVYSHPGFCRTKATSAGVVVGHALNRKTFAGLSLMNAKGIKTLLANPEREDAPPTPAIWNFPDEFKTAPEGHWAEISPVMRNGDLILCRTIQEDSGATESLCLYYFARDKRDAVKIPLSFDTATVSDPAQARVIARPSMNFQSLASTDHGLIICNPAGFWILPWKDIDKHRAKIGIEAARHPSFGLQFKFAGH